jgi:hypothetical protein
MHACEVVVRFFRITGVILHLGADVVREMAQGVRRSAAAAGGATAAFGCRRGVADDWKFHDEGSSIAVRSLFSNRCARSKVHVKSVD